MCCSLDFFGDHTRTAQAKGGWTGSLPSSTKAIVSVQPQCTAISPEEATVLLAALSARGRDRHYAEFRRDFLEQGQALKLVGVLCADYNPEHPKLTPEVVYRRDH